MPNLQDIRRRIGSVRNTQKITRAMKMVAAAKLRRAQEKLLSMRPYAYHMRELTASLLTDADRLSHPLLRKASGNRICLVVVTSDRGLCGGFNANIVNETMRQIRDRFRERPVVLSVVGRKGVEALRRRKCTVVETHVEIFDKLSANVSARIVDGVVSPFVKGETSEVYCIYNEFKSATTQRIAVEKLLPYEPPDPKEARRINFIFEPREEDVLFMLLVENIQVQMQRILRESVASECGARMAAMDSATKNAGDVIANLTLTYNRARQDAITTEVVEVVSGAESL